MGNYQLLMKQHSRRAKAEATNLLRPNFRNYLVTSAISLGKKVTELAQIQGEGKQTSIQWQESGKEFAVLFNLHSPLSSLIYLFVLCVFNSFNEVIVFLKLENDSSQRIQKFLISGQFEKLQKNRTKQATQFVICFTAINSHINRHWFDISLLRD